ncbi:hypothetical protein BU16DRAFT_512860 [Lophium mytilinum]|uniref:histidine kinase n=1 Tax=Lophium mytilinum TaxID=390894 RepID=A0A6A6QLY9_9PEZI|nr:hypothetical protein BU16DRAFT_512860 [Lophium mytilinum]
MPKSCSPTAREREVYRYYQPSDDPVPTAKSYPRTDVPRSSSDPVLTAFAQLGAHRLRAKRGLITLSTRETEYILAESGVGLGLQQDDDKNDPLWHGTVALHNTTGLGMKLCHHFCSSKEDLPYAAFDDLRNYKEFKDQYVVTHPPHIRFLTCVPLRSSIYNAIIGTYIVVDDKPRDGLTEEEVEFMIDMGVTVMDYLDAQRNNRKQHRAERMVKAIGLFIEGKSTLREWWLQGGHKREQTKVTKRARTGTTTLDVQADIEFGVQDPVEQTFTRGMESLSEHDGKPLLSRSPSSSTLSHIERKGDGRPKIPNRDSTYSASDTTIPSAVFSPAPQAASVTTADTTEGSTTGHVRHTSVAFDMPQETADVSKELQEALLTKDLKAVFARASNLIREAGGVDGSIFFDASVGSFGAASEKDIMGQKAPGTFHVDETMTTSDDDFARKSSDQDTPPRNANDGSPSEQCCNILGFSTRKRSSLKGHSPPPEHHTFPERVLRTLLKRYPHGKVFNFDEDGSFSSSDTDNAYIGGEDEDGPRKHVKSEATIRRKKVSREAEAAALLKALPGARSIFWFPLWDPTRERWYAGSLVWSTGTRTLCPIEDLAYLAAFGNSIMAEVARLAALVLTQMKTDFISSISHELRSPLHGVLASVEFLQETPLTEVQADMVSNINASGRVLLDTINHVLDFSKVNKKVKGRGKVSKRRTGKKQRLSFQDHENLDNTAEDNADMCILSEEVVESVWAGRNMSKLLYPTPASHQRSRPQSMIGAPETPVTIIMDIRWQPNWTFEMDAGAWRRILMNLFGNSMKYTKSGFIKVSMAVEENTSVRGKKARSMLVLKVKDSGKGMSREYMKHHLYKPFTQEDSLAVGAGLGLSIVRHIIQDLGGEINFTSEQGVGTEATVKLPMVAGPPTKDDISDLVADVKGSTKGKKFHLEGFDRYPDISETPTGILSADSEAAMFLKSSIHVMLTEWFEMDSSTACISDKTAEVVVIMESGIPSLMEKLQSYEPGTGPSIAIILCSAYPPTGTATVIGSLRVFYVPQPYGPHKIAKTLHHAFTQSFPPEPTQDTTALPTTTPSTIPEPGTLSTGAEFHTPQYHGFATPKPPLSPPHPAQIDRRTSIDTSIMQPTGMRILLVEDNEINLKLLVAYMRKLKLNHATAINGLEALNTYKEAKGGFDVIFMDISMPIMDGIESTRHIRRFERETSIQPVALIALTGAANPNTRQEAFSSGIDLFLTKPVPMKNLKVMLDDLKVNGRQGLMA